MSSINLVNPVSANNYEKMPEPKFEPALPAREVDVGKVALKALATLASILTSSFLTVTVGVMKATQVTIIPTTVLGWLTKPVHMLNTSLTQHAFTPFQKWAKALDTESSRMIETEKVVAFANGKLLFFPDHYAKQAKNNLAFGAAPISAAFIALTAAVLVAVKPLYMLVFFPGFVADSTIGVSVCWLNKAIASLTYSPLEKAAEKMYDFQVWLVNSNRKSLEHEFRGVSF